jgi:hypothetical protein
VILFKQLKTKPSQQINTAIKSVSIKIRKMPIVEIFNDCDIFLPSLAGIHSSTMVFTPQPSSALASSKILCASSSLPIGIGAGVDCDGQVLVSYDMLGITQNPPKFVKNFLTSGSIISATSVV